MSDEKESNDGISIFSYDGEFDADQFNLHKLETFVNAHFKKPCKLEKLAEGGYHKVYICVT